MSHRRGLIGVMACPEWLSALVRRIYSSTTPVVDVPMGGMKQSFALREGALCNSILLSDASFVEHVRRCIRLAHLFKGSLSQASDMILAVPFSHNSQSFSASDTKHYKLPPHHHLQPPSWDSRLHMLYNNSLKRETAEKGFLPSTCLS